MSDESSIRNAFEDVAESFLLRFRSGERPSISEYARRYPVLADRILRVFPAMVCVEEDLSIKAAQAPPLPDSAVTAMRRLADYRILRKIGRGGMGVVYEADQVSLERGVALKVLAQHMAGDSKAMERFRREAKSAARMHHTSIVPVFDVGHEEDHSYYAMQLIEGQGLDQVIRELRNICIQDRKSARQPGFIGGGEPVAKAAVKRESGIASERGDRQEVTFVAESLLAGRLAEGDTPAGSGHGITESVPDPTVRFGPESVVHDATLQVEVVESPALGEGSSSAVLPGGRHVSEIDSSGRRLPFFRSVAQVGRQAAQGLAHAHARGILHRDIKPSNLLLDNAGFVWITDFGLAKTEEDGLTGTGDILVTLRYMPPERFRGEGDGRSDVYALGLTLYELMTLRPAFDAMDRLKLMEQIKNEEPPRPRTIDGRIPRDLETIVLKAIEKEPNRRYTTAEASAEDLRRFIADEPIKARQVGASERYWRWARRNPVIAVLGVVITAMLVATAIGSTMAASYFHGLATSEALANRKSQIMEEAALAARHEAIDGRDRSRQLSANLALEKGIALGEEGRTDQGLLWMLEAIRIAPEDAEKFQRMVRLNLGAWLGQVHKPLRIFETSSGGDLAFSPDGRSFARSHNPPDDPSSAKPVGLWESASGRMLKSFPGAFGPFAFRQDGKVLVACTHDRRFVTAFDLATKRELWKSPQLPGRVLRWIRFGGNGSTLFLECDEMILEFGVGQIEHCHGPSAWGADPRLRRVRYCT